MITGIVLFALPIFTSVRRKCVTASHPTNKNEGADPPGDLPPFLLRPIDA